MKPRPFDYIRPDTVDESLSILAEHGEDARILAGGQTLIAMLNLRVVEAPVLIDITRIRELDAIREVDGTVEIGATVTQNRLLQWPSLVEKLPRSCLLSAISRPATKARSAARLHTRTRHRKFHWRLHCWEAR